MPNRGPAATDDSEQIQVDHVEPNRVLGVFEIGVLGVAAGDVDQHIESSEVSGDSGYRILHDRPIGDVDPDDEVAIGVGKPGHHVPAGLLIEIGERDSSPLS